jgi:hypothetical protein
MFQGMCSLYLYFDISFCCRIQGCGMKLLSDTFVIGWLKICKVIDLRFYNFMAASFELMRKEQQNATRKAEEFTDVLLEECGELYSAVQAVSKNDFGKHLLCER